MEKRGGRKLKKSILALLSGDDLPSALTEILEIPPRQAVNPLFSFLYHGSPEIRWRSVTAMGVVTAALADADMESARIVMRRLMWNLNDESGGIGWGSPEAMGEILARHEGLASEYSAILLSYIRENGNFLEHEILQRGALWGVGRLAHRRPERVRDAASSLIPFIQSRDPYLCGLAVWAAGPVRNDRITAEILSCKTDLRRIDLYIDMEIKSLSIGDLAANALAA